MTNALEALFLGIVEGLTEFIPVSSTGHLLLIGHFIGFESAGNTFAVMIQLGAVLAIMTVYAARLSHVVRAAPHDPAARRFLISVLVAFLPAVFIGVLAHDLIKTVLFETPRLIALMLILGGVILLFVDRFAPEPKHEDAMRLPLSVALRIGFVQCVAMIPGVSRSGATIVGALLMGVGKRAAAEFSFFLSIPTMLGAFTYDLWRNRDVLDAGEAGMIAIGFAAAFVSGLCVVRWLLGYISRHGYAVFGWWRIGVGCLAMTALTLWG
ncbi:undecaprenyl-diphosphate phosphatase [Falsirhodobacter halotolerans]|uniref:undecaprenyl-diphosphate phosphatase n=1 Tax=Falsirhodobacter halotolerans TaxID=1146892 RepID=UPI001FD5F9E4|nr:undecaprenyl-diphosphate phosphatase [Falsirhodobacter halotolerans]MCJ8140769.1 undecaprenyl-diphosphate phosphatase [Falsirhodobacter halotolerans]